MIKMHFWGVGGRSFKGNKNKNKKTKDDEKPDIKIIFLVHKKTTKRSLLRPLLPHLPDFDVLLCFVGGNLGSGDGGFRDPFLVGWTPGLHHSGAPNLGFRGPSAHQLHPSCQAWGWGGEGRGLDTVTEPLGSRVG